MCGDDFLGGQAGLALQAVDVLSEDAQQQALFMQQRHEVVRGSRAEVSGEQLLRLPNLIM